MHQVLIRARRGAALVFFCLALLLGSCSGGGESPASKPPGQGGPTLDQLQVSLSDTTLPKGITRQLHAIGIYPDKTNEDFTDQVSWSSGNSSVLLVDSKGVLTATGTGSTAVTATYGGQTASLDVIVTAARLSSIHIAPRDLSLPQSITQQLIATGTYSDGSSHDISDEVTWSSSDNTIVSLSAQGMATATGLGNVTISASIDSIRDTTQITGSAAVLVDIEITEQNPILPLGTNLQLGVLGIFSDDSTQDITSQVSWSSNDSNIAAISAQGLLSSQSLGSTTLTASYSGITTNSSVTITSEELVSIEIFPSQVDLPAGTELQLSATGVYTNGTTRDLTKEVTWQSGDVSTASVNNAAQTAGLLTAVSTGNTTVSAYLGATSSTAPITISAAILQAIAISPSNVSIALGTHQTFTATGNYSDGSTQDITEQVEWTSSDTDIANTDAGSSKFVSFAAGSIQVTANLENVFAFTEFTVTSATLDSIALTPANKTIPKGVGILYTATGTYSDLSTQDISELVTWSSSDSSKASISNLGVNKGNATGILEGVTTVSATYNGINGSTNLTVSPATLASISVAATDNSMNTGTTQQLTATGHYSDSSTEDITNDVTWSSSDTGVATVSNSNGDRGTISALGVGVATITATFNGQSANIDISVVDNPNAPKSLSVSASPNVIFNDGSDSATISIVVQANSPSGTIADGTQINIEIGEGTQITNQTVYTTNGAASLSLTSTYNGFVPFRLTLPGSDISTTGAIASTSNFARVFLRGGFMEPQYNNGVYLSNSLFAMYIVNYSNRIFDISNYQIKNGGVTIATIPSDLFDDDGQLGHGESVTVVSSFASDTPDNGVTAQFNLSDPATLQQFSIIGTYIYSPQ